MANGVRIVAVSKENFDDLLPLIEGYQRFYQVENIEPERNRRFFSQLLEKPEEGVQFLAYSEDKPVGFVTLYFPYSSTQAAAFALMNDLFVASEIRGQGIGLALIEKAREVAAARGFDKLSWMTAEDNTVAQQLYNKLDADKSTWLEYALKT